MKLADLITAAQRAIAALESAQPLAQLAARLYVAQAFFLSGLTKIRNWDTTLALFADEYHVPLLPPHLAAVLGTAGELALPVLLVLGLAGRFAAAGLFVVNLIAAVSLEEIAPAALQQHVFWGSLLVGLVLWGPGRWALDRWILPRLTGSAAAPITGYTRAALRRRHLIAIVATAPLSRIVRAQGADWSRIEAAAKGQTVYMNAWAGSERVNAYLQWASGELMQRAGIKLEHVKVSDTAEAVKRVRAEKSAGRTSDGSVDLVWINGENFLAMKREGLLFGPWSEKLPSYANVDVSGKPTTRSDFSEAVEGLEAPWGMAQLTFYADSARVPKLPDSVAELMAWAKANPGRFTYPKPPQFHGTTFLKQVLLESTTDRALLYAPHNADVFAKATAPLWSALDALHPNLWKRGKQFPANNTVTRQMLADGELAIAHTFNPNEVANQIAAKTLPASVVAYQHGAGTIGNTHFLAIPFNARAKEAAQVAANFFLSPAAQARKADIKVWGDPTVLALDKLSAADRELFSAAAAPGQVAKTAPVILEPHGSWVDPIEREWARRYGQG
jgi:putative thiamine transport system substrate-binding protein